MEASRKVGLDLGRYGGSQEDGRYNEKVRNGEKSTLQRNVSYQTRSKG